FFGFSYCLVLLLVCCFMIFFYVLFAVFGFIVCSPHGGGWRLGGWGCCVFVGVLVVGGVGFRRGFFCFFFCVGGFN
ncbi:hypothetical protein PUR57_00660, partial [Streptomyces sp. JV176]|uniref:hypothetical protein n=1 Tax=Streptomyces sp. JV176 TaxID=858630 RepID=UPI002E75D6E6